MPPSATEGIPYVRNMIVMLHPENIPPIPKIKWCLVQYNESKISTNDMTTPTEMSPDSCHIHASPQIATTSQQAAAPAHGWALIFFEHGDASLHLRASTGQDKEKKQEKKCGPRRVRVQKISQHQQSAQSYNREVAGTINPSWFNLTVLSTYRQSQAVGVHKMFFRTQHYHIIMNDFLPDKHTRKQNPSVRHLLSSVWSKITAHCHNRRSLRQRWASVLYFLRGVSSSQRAKQPKKLIGERRDCCEREVQQKISTQ